MAKQMGRANKERRADSIYMVLILAHWHDTIGSSNSSHTLYS
jgi:hypothetical protein